MGIAEASTAVSQVHIQGQAQVSILRKAMETRQEMAMALIQKQAQISNEIQQNAAHIGQNINLQA